MIEGQQKCLDALAKHSIPNGALCTYFRTIEAETGMPRKEVRRHVRALARKGLAKYHKGLWSEETDLPAGAGYCITKAGRILAVWPS